MRRWASMVSSLAFVAVLGLAAAEQGEAQQEQQEPVEVTDELLERFVLIYPTVVEVSRAAQQELEQTTDQAEAQQIQAEANDEIVSTLEEAELSLREYDGVIRAINQDEELMQEFQALMAEIHGDPGLR